MNLWISYYYTWLLLSPLWLHPSKLNSGQFIELPASEVSRAAVWISPLFFPRGTSECRFSLGHHLNWAVFWIHIYKSCCSMQCKPVNICQQRSASSCLVFGHGFYFILFFNRLTGLFRKSGLFEKVQTSHRTPMLIQEANSCPPHGFIQWTNKMVGCVFVGLYVVGKA